MKNLVLISTYFGNFPNYFNLWLKSAAKNNDIDFIIYSDCKTSAFEPIPNNVKIINISFDNLKTKIQSKFDFEITLNTPYKLCDYKPAYGYIFEDDLAQYKYWGHIDIDTILGDIKSFLPNEDYEKLYQLGHLCIYHNTYENNRRFMLDGGQNYKDVFTTQIITVFDEFQGMQQKFDLLKIKTFISYDYADITKRSNRFILSNIFANESNKLCNYDYQVFYYENGKIYRSYLNNGEIKKQEFNYIHFSSRKMPDYTNGADSFYITNTGFYPKNEEVTKEIIEKYNPLTPIKDNLTFIKWRKNDAVRKIKKIIQKRKER